MKRSLIVFCFATLVAVPSAALAQDQWTEQVRGLLQEGGKTFEAAGYELTHHIYTGSLNQGDNEVLDMDLDIGKDYKIMAACDQDCSDIDLILYDGSGNEVDSDLENDDFPIVSASVTQSGGFHLKVKMVSCTAEPCRYGIGIFGR